MSVVEVRDEGPVRVIAFDRPERRNAVSPELFEGVHDALPKPEDNAVRAIVLTGNGAAFCAGGDIKAPPSPIQPGSRRHREIYNPLISRLVALPQPVVAAVNGPAMGAGFSLALVADLRVVARGAFFASGFVDLGLATDTGASWLLPRVVGYSRAFDILTTGRRVGADEALAMGLATSVVEPDEVVERAVGLAMMLAAKPGIAVFEIKGLLQAASARSLSAQLEAEVQAYDRASAHPSRRAAKRAMVEKISRS